MRRDVDSRFAAYKFDPGRRELYVEGRRDRVVLNYLVGEEQHPDVTVVEINEVDLPERAEGGNKGRLISFARLALDTVPVIRAFADADYDRILSVDTPTNVVYTDYHDLEGYVLRPECIQKIWGLGLGSDINMAEAVEKLAIILAVARSAGLIRVMAELERLQLPFRTSDLSKYVDVKVDPPSLKIKPYLQTLMQGRGIPLNRLTDLQVRLLHVQESYSSVSNAELVHGKDCLSILRAFLGPQKVSVEQVEALVWTSFDRTMVETGSQLEYIVNLLRTGW
jgi:hypothetical protein